MSPTSATRTIGVGFAVAATAALAQLGLAYGFGLLSWADAAPGSLEPVLDDRFNANLAWVSWFAAASCVVGGLASGVIGSRGEAANGTAVRVTAVAASAIGAFAVGPLVALSAERGAIFTEFQTEPLLAAGMGAVVGFVLTLIGLGSRAVAVNVGASVALIWLLAVLATFTEVGEQAMQVTELAVWGSWAGPESVLGRRGFSIAVPFVLGSALIGAVVAAYARRGPISHSGYRIAAASGIAGPLIVTVAHLSPSRLDSPESMAVLLVGPYAAIAGLLGSLVISALPRSGGQLDDRLEAAEAETSVWQSGAETTQLREAKVPQQPKAPKETKEPKERKSRWGRKESKSDPSLVETAPGWTVPAAPDSAFDAPGDTKELTAKEADVDPDVDWVQELKPVDGEKDSLDPEVGTEAGEKPKPKRRGRKAAKPTRRKLTGSDAGSDNGADSDH
ncbi:hypothetical protein [Glycomyces buryatensis]|uniref:Uncharacterized protein n=1 Tax=Glycomyces buryatensis TaxID=2570927 RepID=A0A4S8Q774_9ACTN|nr:hypothetical protein [Glycomyces buryatensis]THV40078.1 hypothetical protein FAB82_16250 [Glycomyces buryatensis]